MGRKDHKNVVIAVSNKAKKLVFSVRSSIHALTGVDHGREDRKYFGDLRGGIGAIRLV